eukprot:GDKI01000968.1.p1 GENE.GDKI01000968.1~~GDKI01000968.1.p1  ORF type:complete len:116 (-),score=10.41 GDKI01000968.1:140-487(-)
MRDRNKPPHPPCPAHPDRHAYRLADTVHARHARRYSSAVACRRLNCLFGSLLFVFHHHLADQHQQRGEQGGPSSHGDENGVLAVQKELLQHVVLAQKRRYKNPNCVIHENGGREK